MSTRPSDYECRARDETTLIKRAADAAGLHEVINKALSGTLSVLGDAAALAVRPAAVYAEFRKAGHVVHQPADVSKLDLEEVDAVVGWLDAKYKGLAFGEGAAAGATGVPGLVADIPALVGLNLRAIAEYATYYGFDVATERERVFAMHVLGLASSPHDAVKVRVMQQLSKIAADAAKKKGSPQTGVGGLRSLGSTGGSYGTADLSTRYTRSPLRCDPVG